MAKKKIIPVDPDQDELPEGKKDEDLEEDLIYDLDEIDDDMLADETEEEEFGMEVDEVVKMLRGVKCKPCPGLKSIPNCKIAKDHGCPKPNKP